MDSFYSMFGTSGSHDGQFEGPQGCVVSSDGKVYIAERTENIMFKSLILMANFFSHHWRRTAEESKSSSD